MQSVQQRQIEDSITLMLRLAVCSTLRLIGWIRSSFKGCARLHILRLNSSQLQLRTWPLRQRGQCPRHEHEGFSAKNTKTRKKCFGDLWDAWKQLEMALRLDLEFGLYFVDRLHASMQNWHYCCQGSMRRLPLGQHKPVTNPFSNSNGKFPGMLSKAALRNIVYVFDSCIHPSLISLRSEVNPYKHHRVIASPNAVQL